MNKKIGLGIGIFTLLWLGVGLCFLWLSKPYTWRGTVFQPPNPAFNIQLKNTLGQNFQMAQEKGKIVLLVFGYTHCPDECPLILARLKQVKGDFGPMANKLEVVFVSVDPKRDDGITIQTYLAAYDPSFIGLAGNQTELEPFWQAYGVYAQTNGGTMLEGYQVVHSTELYLIDGKGRMRLGYNSDAAASDIEQDTRRLLQFG
jgi:protein SCO1/2